MEKNSYTVLIVDDEQIEREAIRMILETSHLPISFIYEANSGRKMLEMTASHSVDIIILDINMPGLSGLQALEMLRSEGRETKVIISTAYDEFNFAVKALQSGAVDFLVKPVDENEPVGVYFIDGVNPTKQEEAEAMFSYLYAVGKPRRGMWVLPAYCFPNCIDNSPENLQALREKGALIPNSVDKE